MITFHRPGMFNADFLRIALAMLAMVAFGSVPSTAAAGDYFLTARQKADLILHGSMSDADGLRYNVWIVPGYVPPARNAGEGWEDAGEAMADYGDAETYREIGRSSRNTVRHAREDVLKEFALRGTSRAWNESLSTAKRRTSQRVFGWWMAYPWALGEGTLQTLVRIGGGVPASAVTALGGVTVVPVAGLLAPTVKALGHAALSGTLYPLAAVTWNTAIAPPLALLGEQPAPERADGFWMKLEDAQPSPPVAVVYRLWQDAALDAPEFRAQVESHARAKRSDEERLAALRAEVERLEQNAQVTEEQFEQQRRAHLIAEAQSNGESFRRKAEAAGIDAAQLRSLRPALKSDLMKQGWQEDQVEALLDGLLGTESGEDSTPRRADPTRTDPLQRGIDILDNPDDPNARPARQ